MKTNKKTIAPPARNNEGYQVRRIDAPEQLRRSVSNCLLWEDGFYESGEAISERIHKLVGECDPGFVSNLAIHARSELNLRHVALYLVVCMVKWMIKVPAFKPLVAATLEMVIQRADEPAEFLALYWKEGKRPIPACVKTGLGNGLRKFNEYQLAKYNRDNDIKLRDVLRLCHPKPVHDRQSDLWKRLIAGELATPDTWEVQLSSGKDKKQAWIDLLGGDKLGALALLRNLRNMTEVGVPDALIRAKLLQMNTERVLPFRFISAARHAPQFESELEAAMLQNLNGLDKLPGKTGLVIDTSPSMWGTKVSAKSELDRFEAAAALAIMLREICEHVHIVAFNEKAYLVPPRHGFALRDALQQTKGGASMGQLGVHSAQQAGCDRIIVLTDGEWQIPRAGSLYGINAKPIEVCPNPGHGVRGYMINVAASANGVGYGPWVTIDGFSESVVRFVQSVEA